MDGNWKTNPTPPGNIDPLRPPQSQEFQFFLAPQSPDFLMAKHSFYLPPSRIFMKRVDLKLILFPVYSFHVIFNTGIMRLSFTLSIVCIDVLGIQCMPEKAPTTADFSLLSSLSPWK